jgi:hypothetical protein
MLQSIPKHIRVIALCVAAALLFGGGYLAAQRLNRATTGAPVDDADCAPPPALAYPAPQVAAYPAAGDAYPAPPIADYPASEAAYPATQPQAIPLLAPCPTAPVVADAAAQSSGGQGMVAPGEGPLVPVPDVAEPLPPLVLVRQGNLWRSDGNGAPLQQLTRVDGLNTSAGAPVFSPDGRQIAFTLAEPPKADAVVPMPRMSLHVMNADGSNQREVWSPEQAMLWRPAWAPDGRAIYVAANEWRTTPGQNESINVIQALRVDIDSGVAQPIVQDAVSATPSRDGRRLAYVRRVNGYQTQLEVSAPDGSAAQIVVPAGQFEEVYAPRFAPNSTQIVFTAVGGPAVDPNGNPVATAPAQPLGGLLSLFDPPSAQAHGEAYDLWVVNADGTGLRRLTWLLADSPIAAYSPDGAEIIINSGTGMYRMNADGSRLRRVDPTEDHTGGGIDWGAR